MTAEIAILNKSAVALAADSAITIGNEKIYNSGNKLFILSKYRPVGIMVFGNAEFMGVPWETIIKYYRSELKTKKFNKLVDYANDFIAFIENEKVLFWPIEEQEKHYIDMVSSFYKSILIEIDNSVKEHLQKGTLHEEELGKIINGKIKNKHDEWMNLPDLFDEFDQFHKVVMDTYKATTRKIIKEIFQFLPINDLSLNLLLTLGSLFFCKRRFTDRVSGIVIAGFGELEIFPSAIEFYLESIVLGRLKFQKRDSVQITREQNAIIIPFAQHEMVNTFVEGIDPGYRDFLIGYYNNIISKYPKTVLSIISEISIERKSELQKKLNSAGKKILEDFETERNNYISVNHINPILEAVSVLPKDELASMAESLVNLTSFKRKISMQAETVGGPIDVAVISKGDGFVWIKRKHYFKPEYNQTFINNYYREDKEK